MALSNDPVFTQTGRTPTCVTTAAKTTLGDATNAVKLMDGGANGSQVIKLHAAPRATVTATQLQLYLSADNGTTLTLIDSALMAAYTMANTTAVPKTLFSEISPTTPLRIPFGSSLWVGAGVLLAAGHVWTAQVEDW